MGFWGEVNEVKETLELLRKIENFSLYNRAKEPVVSGLMLDDMKNRARFWKKEILKRFDEYFIKEANIAVLDRKKKEIIGE